MHSNQPDQEATATADGYSHSYKTDGSGYALIYLNAPRPAPDHRDRRRSHLHGYGLTNPRGPGQVARHPIHPGGRRVLNGASSSNCRFCRAWPPAGQAPDGRHDRAHVRAKVTSDRTKAV